MKGIFAYLVSVACIFAGGFTFQKHLVMYGCIFIYFGLMFAVIAFIEHLKTNKEKIK